MLALERIRGRDVSASYVQQVQATVSWGASTDPDGDPVRYEL